MIGAVSSKQRQKDSLLARSIVLPSIGTENCLLSLKTPPLTGEGFRTQITEHQEIILTVYHCILALVLNSSLYLYTSCILLKWGKSQGCGLGEPMIWHRMTYCILAAWAWHSNGGHTFLGYRSTGACSYSPLPFSAFLPFTGTTACLVC